MSLLNVLILKLFHLLCDYYNGTGTFINKIYGYAYATYNVDFTVQDYLTSYRLTTSNSDYNSVIREAFKSSTKVVDSLVYNLFLFKLSEQ